MSNSTTLELHNQIELSTMDCELRPTWDGHWDNVNWDLYIKICKMRKPIDIHRVIREGGDIGAAVNHNLKLLTKFRTKNLPFYVDQGK